MGAQVAHQGGKIAIAHQQPLDIGDRQREARPLQKRAHVAHIGERRDMRD